MDQRQTIIETHHRTILELRQIEKKIENMLAANDPNWRSLEAKRNDLQRHIEPLIEQYWNWIPSLQLSKCPFCHDALERKFDIYDFNGFWWMDRTQRTVSEPKSCQHFCLLSGAVNLNGHPPTGGLFECRPGPDKPFIYPRLMEMFSMKVVITELLMACGYKAYPIAYYSEQPVQVYALTQSWAKKEYTFSLDNGRSGWNMREDQQDFNLRAWINSKRIYVYKNNQLALLQDGDDLLNVKGVGKNQRIFDHILSFERST